MLEKRLLWGAVPPHTTATPAENGLPEKKLLEGAVPPPTTATPAENELSEKKLLWGAVPPPTMTAEIGLPKPKSRTVPTSQTLILKKIAAVKLPGVDLKKEVIMSN